MQRVMAYLDGFNLFYGLRDSGWRRYYWLNPSALVSNLLRPGQQLMGVRYFTARITPSTADPGKHLRQQTYLEAIGTLGGYPHRVRTLPGQDEAVPRLRCVLATGRGEDDGCKHCRLAARRCAR